MVVFLFNCSLYFGRVDNILQRNVNSNRIVGGFNNKRILENPFFRKAEVRFIRPSIVNLPKVIIYIIFVVITMRDHKILTIFPIVYYWSSFLVGQSFYIKIKLSYEYIHHKLERWSLLSRIIFPRYCFRCYINKW